MEVINGSRIKLVSGIFKKKIENAVVTKVVHFENEGGLFGYDLKHIYAELDNGKNIKFALQDNEICDLKYKNFEIID